MAVTVGIIRACQRDRTTNNTRRHSDARVLRILTMDYIKCIIIFGIAPKSIAPLLLKGVIKATPCPLNSFILSKDGF